jgi:hypothetical protein
MLQQRKISIDSRFGQTTKDVLYSFLIESKRTSHLAAFGLEDCGCEEAVYLSFLVISLPYN